MAIDGKMIMNYEVKGGLVIKQLMRYARRLSDHTGDSVHISLGVWHNCNDGVSDYTFEYTVWDSGKCKFLKQNSKWLGDDIREIGKLIDQYIENENKIG